ncbi:TetR/AcrR family transcriptional regulator [Sphingobium sp. EM0848]|uniref:TetR/AcrR family transcriptional regulator n=1 Tax=Sphingobium sp. EM0848 TaxID=2743473 RepID=UPI00159C5BAA|nr:TetR/AcrR family transcriptional regulator [Sphingobium sp. EM0848]
MQTKTRKPRAKAKMADAPGMTAALPEQEKAGSADNEGAKAVRHRTTVLRRAILDTAAAMFAEKGFVGTNLQDIADAFGMSRPGLYYHFPSKEKLLEAIIEELTLSAERQLTQIAQDKDGEPEETLRLVVQATTLWLLDHQIYFRLLDRAESDLPEELKASNEASKRKNLEYFVGVIERGIATGKFRPVDPHIAALAIAGMRNWAAWWYSADGRLTAQEIAEIISDLAVRSVLRSDAHRSRSDNLNDVVRILQEDVSHLAYLIRS